MVGNVLELGHCQFVFATRCGYVEQNVLCALYVVVVKQRRIQSLGNSLEVATFARSLGRTEQRHATVLHYRIDISEVNVYVSMSGYYLGNTLSSSNNYLVGLLERGRECAVLELDEFVVVYYQKRINGITHLHNTLVGLIYTLISFGGKWYGDNTNRKHSLVLCSLCNYRSGTSSCSATHTCGNEDHLSIVVEKVGNFSQVLLCGILANLRVVACTKTSRKFLAKLNLY